MIETLIHKHLANCNFLQENLATFQEKPAIFYIEAANDTAPGWDNGKMFPRVDYYVDWTADHERGSSGTLIIECWCRKDGTIMPETFGLPLREHLKNTFFNDATEIYGVNWNDSMFSDGAGNEPKVEALVMRFDIMAFPVQRFPVPDPVASLVDFVGAQSDNYSIVGKTALAEIFTPADDKPLIYVHLIDSRESRPPQYGARWLLAKINVHVFAGTVTGRMYASEMLERAFMLSHDFDLEGGSWMRTQSISCSMGADPLRTGQIQLQCEYGIMPDFPDGPKLKEINVDVGLN